MTKHKNDVPPPQFWQPYPSGAQDSPRKFQPIALSCQQVESHLDAYAHRDTQLSAQLFWQLHDHISTCTDCRHKLYKIREQAGLIPPLEDLRASEPQLPPADEE